MFSVSPTERKLRQCVMPSCEGQRFDLVHKFPMDNERAETWRRIIKVPHLMKLPIAEVRKKYFICSQHFPQRDYKNCESRSLNKTAIPRLLLSASDDDQSQDTDEVGTSNHSLLLSDDDIHAHNTLINDTISSVQSNEKKIINVRNLIKLKKVQPTSTHSAKFAINNRINPSAKSENRFILSDSDIKRPAKRYSLVEGTINRAEKMPRVKCTDPIEEENALNDSENYINIEHFLWPNGLTLANVWLRDHCRCSDCFDQTTKQRKSNILDFSLSVKTNRHSLIDDNLNIEWTDGHQSTYSLDELNELLEDQRYQSIESQSILWNSKSIESTDYARVTLNDFLCDDDVAKNVVRSLIRYGCAFIEKVPPNLQSTEVAIKRLFPIQKTFFGEMWSFSETMTHADSAYTKNALLPHNDNTYFNDAAGLQILHCIHHNGEGGENLLVDGFKATQDLKDSDGNAFKYLTEVNLTAEYIEETRHHKHTAPVIILSPASHQPQQIRFNMNDRAPLSGLPQTEMIKFYQNYRAFAEKIMAPANEWKFKLSPGTVCIFDNWRILHGRTAYTGKRQMVGCYVARNEFLSVARTMGLIA